MHAIVFSRRIINHRFHVHNDKGELGIGYGMIIGRAVMVQLVLTAEFKHQVLQWDGATVMMIKPIGLLGKTYLSKGNMCEVFMQTAEPDFTRKATEILVKIIDSTYAKAYLI